MKLKLTLASFMVFSAASAFGQTTCQKLLNEALKDQDKVSRAEAKLELDITSNFLSKEQAIQLTAEKETARKGLSDVKLLFHLYCRGN